MAEGTGSVAPCTSIERSSAQCDLDAALVAAVQLLTETVNAVTPSTSPRKLLKYVQLYRARLSILVTAYLSLETDQVERITSVNHDSLGS